MSITPLPPPSYVAPSAPAPVTITINQVPGFSPAPVAGVGTGHQPQRAVRLYHPQLRLGSPGRGPGQPGHPRRTFLPSSQTSKSRTSPPWPSALMVEPPSSGVGRIAAAAVRASSPSLPPAADRRGSGRARPALKARRAASTPSRSRPDGSELYAVGSFGSEAVGTVPASQRNPPGRGGHHRCRRGAVGGHHPGRHRGSMSGAWAIGLSTFPVIAVGNAQPTGTRVTVPAEAERSGISGLAIIPDSTN